MISVTVLGLMMLSKVWYKIQTDESLTELDAGLLSIGLILTIWGIGAVLGAP
jgi:hypothetical protein